MKKQYKISDLFITDWLDANQKPTLSAKEMLQVIQYRDQMMDARKKTMHDTAGYYGIMLLKLLRKDKRNVAKINVAQAVDCVNDLTFIHKPWYFFPVKSFTIGGKVFTPPSPKMEDRSFEQLVHADAAFSKYCVTDYQDRHAIPSMDPSLRAESYINDLIAVLYQTPESFSDKNVDADSDAIARKLDASDKAIILHTYANIREYLVDTHPDLLPKPDEQEAPGEERYPVYTGILWLDLMYDLAESSVFPSLEKAGKAEIHKALYYLNKKAGEEVKRQTPPHAED